MRRARKQREIKLPAQRRAPRRRANVARYFFQIGSSTKNWEDATLAYVSASPFPPSSVPLASTAIALSDWTIAPEAKSTATLDIVAGAMLALRLSRWRSAQILREPLLWSLHVGYAWLSLGLLIEGFDGVYSIAAEKSRAARALTVGRIGTMTLAVMTRARWAILAARLPQALERLRSTS